ncbi:MAG TPA: hypothetical protein VGP36_21040 [Mycobacteriales bacterium]|nr:hypothetical protein [Mycobacteriales bacterium]
MDSARVLMRRWYVVLPMLVLTAVAQVLLVVAIPAQYQVKASVVLVQNGPVNSAANPNAPVNPYVASYSLPALGSLLSQKLLAPETVLKVQAAGLPGKYEVLPSIDQTGSIAFSAEDVSAENARKRVDLLISTASAQLATWQSGVPERGQVSARVLSPPSPPIPQNGSRIRAMLVVLVLGVGASIYLAFLVEGLVDRRRDDGYDDARRRSARADASAV